MASDDHSLMKCVHLTLRCELGKFGGRPSPGVCRQCPSHTPSSESMPESPAAAVPAEELARRLAVCGGCDQVKRVSAELAGVECKACGCGLRKVRDGCPVGKF